MTRRVSYDASRWPPSRIAILVVAAALAYGAAAEFEAIAEGTGTWVGEFSAKWAIGLVAFIVAELAVLLVISGALAGIVDTTRLLRWRERLTLVRRILVVLLMATPVVVLQYSPWGVAVRGPYLRLVLWLVCAGLIGILLTRGSTNVWTLAPILAGILLSGAAVSAGAAFREVTDYPFSLGWSEGNRLWDYSLLFGRGLYDLGSHQAPVAYLDFGRQLLGGLPFLLPQVSILVERLWLAFLSIAPFALLGMVIARTQRHGPIPIIVGATWAILFLGQGPIHAPLVVCAILVGIAWRQRTGLAAALVFAAGYFAEISRFTWMFAPAMWAAMLELGAADPTEGRVPLSSWKRAILISGAGLVGCVIAYLGLFSPTAVSQGSEVTVSTSQTLLWYRLLPNATYGDGILLGLLKATGPLVLLLAYVGVRYWQATRWQRVVVVLPLLAFLLVGLIVSTKIGGGGDLHNLDMFLIGLLFAGAILWKALGGRLQAALARANAAARFGLIALVALPAFGPLMALRPLQFSRDAAWLSVLVDVERPSDLGSLPADEATAAALNQIKMAVDAASVRGEVLFMDQRQLLTFGELGRITLVPEFEKKRLMDEALSANEAYFNPFYRDLAAHEFALIISSPLRTPIKDKDYGFGEENNAWVHWVAKPVLCYYQEQDTLNDVKVELLEPRNESVDCPETATPGQP